MLVGVPLWKQSKIPRHPCPSYCQLTGSFPLLVAYLVKEKGGKRLPHHHRHSVLAWLQELDLTRLSGRMRRRHTRKFWPQVDWAPWWRNLSMLRMRSEQEAESLPSWTRRQGVRCAAGKADRLGNLCRVLSAGPQSSGCKRPWGGNAEEAHTVSVYTWARGGFALLASPPQVGSAIFPWV